MGDYMRSSAWTPIRGPRAGGGSGGITLEQVEELIASSGGQADWASLVAELPLKFDPDSKALFFDLGTGLLTEYVSRSGDEVIYGSKVFRQSPDVPHPLTDDNAVPMSYVNERIRAFAGGISLVGSYDAASRLVVTVTANASGAGLVEGSRLPLASQENRGMYLIVVVSGTTTAEDDVKPVGMDLEVGDWLVSDGDDWLAVDMSASAKEVWFEGIDPYLKKPGYLVGDVWVDSNTYRAHVNDGRKSQPLRVDATHVDGLSDFLGDFETVAKNLGAKGVLKEWPYTTSGKDGDFWVMGDVPVVDQYAHLRVFKSCSHIVAHYPYYGEDPVGYWGIVEESNEAFYYEFDSQSMTETVALNGSSVKGRPCVDFDGTLYYATEVGVFSCSISGSDMTYTSARDVIGVAVNMTDVGQHVFVAHSKAQANGRFLSVYDKNANEKQVTTFNTPSAPTMIAGMFIKDAYAILVGHQTEIVRFTTAGAPMPFVVSGLTLPWRVAQATDFVQPLPDSPDAPTSGWGRNALGAARLSYSSAAGVHTGSAASGVSGLAGMDASRSETFMYRKDVAEVFTLSLSASSPSQLQPLCKTAPLDTANTFVQIDGVDMLSGTAKGLSSTWLGAPPVQTPPKKGALIKWEGGKWVDKGPFDLISAAEAGLTQTAADGRYLMLSKVASQTVTGPVTFNGDFTASRSTGTGVTGKAGLVEVKPESVQIATMGGEFARANNLSMDTTGTLLSSTQSLSFSSPQSYFGDDTVATGITGAGGNPFTIRPRCTWVQPDGVISVGGRFTGSVLSTTLSNMDERAVNGALYVRPGSFLGETGVKSSTCSFAVSQTGSVYIKGNGNPGSINLFKPSLSSATAGAVYLKVNTDGNVSSATTLLREDLEQSVQDDLGYITRMRAKDSGEATRIAELEERIEKLENVVRLQLDAIEALIEKEDE